MSMISRSSNKHEQEVAERHSASFTTRRVARSGAGDFKGDVAVQINMRMGFLVEAKETHQTQMVVKKQWWDKIYKEATLEGKDPCLELRMGNRILVGYDSHKFTELIEMSKLPKPLKSATYALYSRCKAVSVLTNFNDWEGLYRTKARHEADFLCMKISFMDQDNDPNLTLCFIDPDFNTKLLESVYGS